MKPTKQNGDAASSEPAANHSASPTKLDLAASPPERRAARDARLQAMQLGDPSSSRQRPRSTGRTSQPLLSPPQIQLQQGLPAARQRRRRNSVDESSSGAVYAWPVGINTGGVIAWGYPAHAPLFVVGYYDPYALFYPLVPQWSSAPSSNSGLYDPIAASVRYDTSAVPKPLLLRALESLELDPALVKLKSPETRRSVIRELEKGDEEARLRMLDSIPCTVHRMIKRSKWHAAFVALLHACELRFEYLQPIVEAACDGQVSLMRLLKHGRSTHGKEALKELIRVAAPYGELCVPLINRLLSDEQMMEQNEGAGLLDYIFDTLPYASLSVIIKFAINNFGAMSSSMFGSMCLIKCFKFAREAELRDLNYIVLREASCLAKGRYSTRFLQRVLELGSHSLKDDITGLVLEDIVRLSMHRFGNYVVQTCFLRTGSRRLLLLERVLAAFRGLNNGQLRVLVQNGNANLVVCKLLEAGENPFPEETRALAQRIEEQLVAVQGQNYCVGLVMEVVRKVLPQQEPR